MIASAYRYPSFEKEGAVLRAGNIRPALPGTNCDLDKFDPIARDWDRESLRAIRKGGPPVRCGAIWPVGPGDPPRSAPPCADFSVYVTR
jgi:hypothetical protein